MLQRKLTDSSKEKTTSHQLIIHALATEYLAILVNHKLTIYPSQQHLFYVFRKYLLSLKKKEGERGGGGGGGGVFGKIEYL